jgi:hypothetical protein
VEKGGIKKEGKRRQESKVEMQGRKARWGRQGGRQWGKVGREDQLADKEFYKTDINKFNYIS